MRKKILSKEVIQTLKENEKILKRKFKLKEIAVFGSFARGDQKPRSDVDILVEFEKGHKTYDNYMELKFHLEDILNAKVDLVTKAAIRQEMRERILEEAVHV